jgi:hypothetical protein
MALLLMPNVTIAGYMPACLSSASSMLSFMDRQAKTLGSSLCCPLMWDYMDLWYVVLAFVQ